MTQYFVVCDNATGAELWRGQCPEGQVAIQATPAGATAYQVPMAAIATATLDLGPVREMLLAAIDADAETVAQKFISPGTSRAMIYQAKAAEANAWLADHNAPTPFLSAEATATATTVPALAAEVAARAAAWTAIGSKIEAARLGAKKAVKEATNITQMHAAAAVNWSQVTSQGNH